MAVKLTGRCSEILTFLICIVFYFITVDTLGDGGIVPPLLFYVILSHTYVYCCGPYLMCSSGPGALG